MVTSEKGIVAAVSKAADLARIAVSPLQPTNCDFTSGICAADNHRLNLCRDWNRRLDGRRRGLACGQKEESPDSR